jgi:hypothetical protein
MDIEPQKAERLYQSKEPRKMAEGETTRQEHCQKARGMGITGQLCGKVAKNLQLALID